MERRDEGRTLLAIAPERFVRRVEQLSNDAVETSESIFDAVGELLLGKHVRESVTLFVMSDHLRSAPEATVATLRALVPDMQVVAIVPTSSDVERTAPHALEGVVDAVLFEPVSDAELRGVLGDPREAGSATSVAKEPQSVDEPKAAKPQVTVEAPPPPPAPPGIAPPRREADAPAHPVDKTAALTSEPIGDTDLIQEIMFGPDALVSQALALIRQQTGWRDVRVVAQSADEHAAPIAFAGDSFGSLMAPEADERSLSAWAHWLARWLALDRSYREYRQLTYRDDLTGAWNRRFFDAFLSQCIQKASARRRPITVMVFDLDHFKRFNDEFGHEAGDEILRETVRLLDSVIRKGDRVCRIGGDEFAVVFADLEGPRAEGSQHPDTVEAIAHRFQDQICKLKFPKLGTDAPGTLSISAGLATYPWDGATSRDLLRKADELAMQSKRRGKNVITFGPGAAEVCKRHPDSSPPRD